MSNPIRRPKKGEPLEAMDGKSGYHRFVNEDGDEYGSFEVFFHTGDPDCARGWYWQACFPGCMPDGDAMGPFETSAKAYDDAQAV